MQFWKLISDTAEHQMSHNSLFRVISNISWLLGDKLLDMILRITVGVLIARYLGAEWFGYLHFALAVIAMLVPVVKLGLSSIVVKHIELDPERKGHLLGTAFVLQLVMSVLVSLSLVLVLTFASTDQSVTTPLILILTVTLLFHSSDPIIAWNQSQVSSKYTVWANRLSSIVAIVIKLGFLYYSVEYAYFVWAWVFESVLRVYLLCYFYLKKESFKTWVFDKKLAVQLLRESWPMMFSGIAAIVYLKIDVVMLGNMKTGTDVGLYSAAVRLSELFYFLPSIVAATLLPAIVRSSKQDKSLFYGNIQALLDAMALYSLLAVVFLYFGAELLVTTLFGSEFHSSSTILQIHAFAIFFVATGTVRDKVLIAEDRMKFIMVSALIGAVINVALNYFLIQKYSGVGAAVATIISYGISGYLACAFWRPTFRHFRMISASFMVLTRPAQLTRYVLSLRNSASAQ